MEMGVADRELLGEIVIGRRFNGPVASANGGYACGAFARFVGEPAEVTLRTAPLLERPLAAVANGTDGVRIVDGDVLVAEVRPV